MDISLFDYELPTNLIANSPAVPRDHSKLLVINRKTNKIIHDRFFDLANYLTASDVLVFNNTKVFPARLFGKKDTGGKIEILLLKNLSQTKWSAMHKGKVKVGDIISFGDTKAYIHKVKDELAELEFEIDRNLQMNFIYKTGHTPIPPYINTKSSEKDLRNKYQTVYAKTEGSVAAPTAGFHFTTDLLNNLKQKGVQMEFVTLHVGVGTFAPVKEKTLEQHKMHSEYFEVGPNVIKRLNQAKKQGKRIIAVGTTTTRVLESVVNSKNQIKAVSGQTDIFIYPSYKFKFVDSLITNFHLPKSTLLALVSAFVSYPNTDHKFQNFGKSLMGQAYREAIENNYHFYSFGDSSLII